MQCCFKPSSEGENSQASYSHYLVVLKEMGKNTVWPVQFYHLVELAIYPLMWFSLDGLLNHLKKWQAAVVLESMSSAAFCFNIRWHQLPLLMIEKAEILKSENWGFEWKGKHLNFNSRVQDIGFLTSFCRKFWSKWEVTFILVLQGNEIGIVNLKCCWGQSLYEYIISKCNYFSLSFITARN